MEVDLLSRREQRAVMLETQTPLYARSDDVRREIEFIQSKAKSLRNALPPGVPCSVRAIIPHQNEYVSGLYVPRNLTTLVGKQAISRHTRAQKRALKRLKRRNNSCIPAFPVSYTHLTLPTIYSV